MPRPAYTKADIQHAVLLNVRKRNVSAPPCALAKGSQRKITEAGCFNL
jgi:hypothetical protein